MSPRSNTNLKVTSMTFKGTMSVLEGVASSIRRSCLSDHTSRSANIVLVWIEYLYTSFCELVLST